MAITSSSATSSRPWKSFAIRAFERNPARPENWPAGEGRRSHRHDGADIERDETIAKDRAHVHFELNLLVNDNFAAWFKKASLGERNDHGEWNGQNLNGLHVRQILLEENNLAAKFNLADFLRGQTELCRVLVRATNFPYLKRYAALVLKNPVAEKAGVAGYEIALNYNASRSR